MTDRQQEGATERSKDETRIQRLLRLAGPAPMPSELRRARVRGAVRAAWMDHTRRRRVRLVWVAAACLGVIAAGVVWLAPERREREAAMIVTKALGDSHVLRAGEVIPLAEGQELRAGDVIETGDAAASMRIGHSTEFRIGPQTSLGLSSARVARLRTGKVYVDSEKGADQTRIETVFGFATDIGTQFEVGVTKAAMRVRVRKGLVELHGESLTGTAGRGSELVLSESGLETRQIDPLSGEWDWTLEVVSPFELEGSSVEALLRWAARESGYEIVYESEGCRQKAATVTLHGELPPSPPMVALLGIQETTNFTIRPDGDRLTVALRPGPSDRSPAKSR